MSASYSNDSAKANTCVAVRGEQMNTSVAKCSQLIYIGDRLMSVYALILQLGKFSKIKKKLEEKINWGHG